MTKEVVENRPGSERLFRTKNGIIECGYFLDEEIGSYIGLRFKSNKVQIDPNGDAESNEDGEGELT